jgi:zona occludens toxin (predicted ATPase)
VRADRYHRLARQYFDLAKETASPSLSASYQRTAEEYRVRAQGEMRVLERQGDLAGKGWSQDTLKIGEQISVQRYKAKSAPMTASARVIELPGGNKMSAADDRDGGPTFPR